MAVGVFDEVADEARQQPPLAAHHYGTALVAPFDCGVLKTHAFFGRECKQVDGLFRLGFSDGFKPAGQQNFVDQRIEFRDVAFDRRLVFGIM